MTIKNRFPDVAPVLNLDFANTKRLDPRITFTRASTGTYVDEFGIVRTAASNGARFDHDSDRNSLGLLVEESRTNLQTYSEDFSQWTITVSNSTPGASVSTNFATAPDGTTTADKFIPVNESFNYIRRGTITASNWSLTVYMKAAGMDYGQIAVGTAGNVRFDLANGTVVTQTNATGQIQALANGWYRCTLVKTGFTSTTEFRIFPGDNSSSSQITTADGVKGILIWGAQAENATFATSYIPTSGSTATRSADVASISNAEMQNYISSAGVTCLMKTIWETSGANQEIHFSDGAGSLSVSQWRQNSLRWLGVVSTNLPNYVYKSNLVTVFAARDTTTAVIGNDQGAYAEVAATLSLGAGDFQFGKFSNSQRKHHILKIMYYPVRLTQSQLQALTL